MLNDYVLPIGGIHRCLESPGRRKTGIRNEGNCDGEKFEPFGPVHGSDANPGRGSVIRLTCLQYHCFETGCLKCYVHPLHIRAPVTEDAYFAKLYPLCWKCPNPRYQAFQLFSF